LSLTDQSTVTGTASMVALAGPIRLCPQTHLVYQWQILASSTGKAFWADNGTYQANIQV